MNIISPLNRTEYPAQTVAFTGTAGNTTGWPAGPNGVLVWADKACYVEVGAGVTATTASIPIPADTPVLIRVPLAVGGTWRVSAIQISAGGNVYAKPVNLI